MKIARKILIFLLLVSILISATACYNTKTDNNTNDDNGDKQTILDGGNLGDVVIDVGDWEDPEEKEMEKYFNSLHIEVKNYPQTPQYVSEKMKLYNVQHLEIYQGQMHNVVMLPDGSMFLFTESGTIGLFDFNKHIYDIFAKDVLINNMMVVANMDDSVSLYELSYIGKNGKVTKKTDLAFKYDEFVGSSYGGNDYETTFFYVRNGELYAQCIQECFEDDEQYNGERYIISDSFKVMHIESIRSDPDNIIEAYGVTRHNGQFKELLYRIEGDTRLYYLNSYSHENYYKEKREEGFYYISGYGYSDFNTSKPFNNCFSDMIFADPNNDKQLVNDFGNLLFNLPENYTYKDITNVLTMDGKEFETDYYAIIEFDNQDYYIGYFKHTDHRLDDNEALLSKLYKMDELSELNKSGKIEKINTFSFFPYNGTKYTIAPNLYILADDGRLYTYNALVDLK